MHLCPVITLGRDVYKRQGQLDGLHHLVIVLGALALFRHGHAVQDAERHEHRDAAVSYTHLDVYKRQLLLRPKRTKVATDAR